MLKKDFHGLMAQAVNLYSAILFKGKGYSDDQKVRMLSSHSTLDDYNISLYMAKDDAEAFVKTGSVNVDDETGFFTIKAGGIEMNYNMTVEYDFTDGVFPVDLVAWIKEVIRCLQEDLTFAKYVDDFKVTQDEPTEVTVEKKVEVEPKDYQEHKMKSRLFDDIFEREIVIKQDTGPHF
jgi:hypothetical protein